MPLNEMKVLSILLDECKTIEERCQGYKEEIFEVVTDIITAERQHKVERTRIQQKINDRLHAAGNFLAENRNSTDSV